MQRQHVMFSIGAALFLIGTSLVMAANTSDAVRSGERDFAHWRVGDFQPDKCCKKPVETSCANNATWTCAAAPVACNAGNPIIDDTCAAATCADQTEARCDVLDLSHSIEVLEQRCASNGMKTNLGCPVGQERCKYDETNVNILALGCATGSTLCATQPPLTCG